MPGSETLIGGDPGIGKSTLLLQMACKMATSGAGTAYFSGEESADQIRLRAKRLNLDGTPPDGVGIATLTDAANIAASLQASPGSALPSLIPSRPCICHRLRAVRALSARCRPALYELIRCAKKRGSPLSFGHVTKAGPSPDRKCSNIWLIRCCNSKVTAAIIPASCAASKTVSAPLMKSVF